MILLASCTSQVEFEPTQIEATQIPATPTEEPLMLTAPEIDFLESLDGGDSVRRPLRRGCRPG